MRTRTEKKILPARLSAEPFGRLGWRCIAYLHALARIPLTLGSGRVMRREDKFIRKELRDLYVQTNRTRKKDSLKLLTV